MFEQSMIPKRAKTGRVWSVVVGFLGQVVVLAVAVLVPLVAFDKLPIAKLTPQIYAPVPRQEPKPEPPHVELVGAPTHTGHKVFEPTGIPDKIARLVDPPAPETTNEPVIPNWLGPTASTSSGRVWLPNLVPAPQPPKPQVEAAPKPPEPVAAPPKPTPIGGKVMLAKLIHQVKPLYPRPAKDARIQGTVNLQAVIGRDGRIRELRVMNGHPLLVNAALEAVRQWEYQPTTLNGQPVEVITTIEVRFILQQ